MEVPYGQSRRPNGAEVVPVRSVRVPKDIWEKARARANSENVTMSHVMFMMVDGYANRLVNLPRVQANYNPPLPPDDDPARSKQEEIEATERWWVALLKHFYEAPGLKLTRAQASAAAREAGIDPRGLGGFFTGYNPLMVTEGDMRVLTTYGAKWYEDHR